MFKPYGFFYEVKEFFLKVGIVIVTIIAIVLIIAILFGLVALMVNPLMEHSCNKLQKLYGEDFEFDYNFWTGCRFKTESGKWIDSDSIDDYYLYLEQTTP
jgi:hypothetical protein